jgi:hypothetical protein
MDGPVSARRKYGICVSKCDERKRDYTVYMRVVYICMGGYVVQNIHKAPKVMYYSWAFCSICVVVQLHTIFQLQMRDDESEQMKMKENSYCSYLFVVFFSVANIHLPKLFFPFFRRIYVVYKPAFL